MPDITFRGVWQDEGIGLGIEDLENSIKSLEEAVKKQDGA